MMEAGYWKRRRRKKARIHQSRERRARFGEMVQIDGSHHDWFEGRGPKCCLLVFVDDATSQLVGLLFQRAETTLGYMQLVEQHVKTHGRPLAYYSDKHSIFKKTREQCVDGLLQDTQLQRALRTLKIELICAHSPQAKGRVERANQTLQDRLVKEMRERKINTIEEANRYAPQFIKKYNKKFGVEAVDSENAHRSVVEDTAHLRRVLSMHETRRLTKNLEFSLEGKLYQIRTKTTGYRLRYKQVEIFKHFDGELEVMFEGKRLEYQVFEPRQRTLLADSKEVNLVVDALVKGEWGGQVGAIGEAHRQLISA